MKINNKYEINPFGSAFDSLFSLLTRDDTCGASFQNSLKNHTNVNQRVRVGDEENQLHIEFLVPGWKKSDLSLIIESGKIELKTNQDKENASNGLFQRENLHLQLSLPENLETEKAKAKLDEGILSVVIPKNTVTQQRRLKIS
ncbi:MAG: Hsp20 family protein [Verrucomicrobiota bacterium]|nr:Hsp20 family protein [Verrucomicrobiota bacterium]